MKYAVCLPDYLGIGFKCVIQFRKITTIDNNTAYGRNYILSISFLSSGSVTNLEELSDEKFATADLVARTDLYYGGYLLFSRKNLQNGCLLNGDIYDDNNKLNSTLDVPENFTIPYPCIVINDYIEKNLDIISNITTNNFTIITSELPRFVDGKIYLFI